MQPLLTVRGLEITFGRGKEASVVTHDVGFDVLPGEILSLVGESGSGKSVTALSILRLLPRQGRVTAGEIRYGNADLLSLGEAALDAVRGADIAMIFQDVMMSLNPVLTIERQMTEGAMRHRGLSRAQAAGRALKLLERTGVRDPERVMRGYPHMLSGGMRQRVMIAMALMCQPKLLIADEPSTALDVTIQLQIMQLLKALRDETGMGILLITHDIGVVAETADRVAVMYAGEVVETAPVETLLTAPRHAYTRALIRAVPDIHEDGTRRLTSIPGSVPERYGGMKGCRFRERCPRGAGCTHWEKDALAEIAPGHLTRCDEGGDALG